MSGSPRYLHTAVMLDDLMLVFGGNTHNDTQISLGAKCYSTDFLAYNPGLLLSLLIAYNLKFLTCKTFTSFAIYMLSNSAVLVLHTFS